MPDPSEVDHIPAFMEVSGYVQATAINSIASYEETGEADENPTFPFKLIYRPSNQVNNLFPDEYTDGDWMSQLMSIEEGTTLFHLWGLNKPTELGGFEWYIGDIITTSEITTSSWGDLGLYFKHDILEDDIDIVPDWQPYEPANTDGGPSEYMSHGAKRNKAAGCPFAHLWK